MAKRFKSQQEIDAFLQQPRLAILMYNGMQNAPTGVPVWFDWNGQTLRLFSAANSPKVQRLREDPNISVLITNAIGEAEGWVAFDGKVEVSAFSQQSWSDLLNKVAPQYWALSNPDYAKEIKAWHKMPEAFVMLSMQPEKIRSGA